MQIFSEECDTKKNNGGALFGGGALYGENTVYVYVSNWLLDQILAL